MTTAQLKAFLGQYPDDSSVYFRYQGQDLLVMGGKQADDGDVILTTLF